ncbi:MAG: DUF371 domain-containing protein [Thermoproteota archaeon]|nr:MAG: DUF371 domain-containing protein [Candidatus Korarchaeota archaeon]
MLLFPLVHLAFYVRVRDNFVGLIKEIIRAKGHPNITGRHETTIEVTRDPEISPRADCIIGVMADKAVKHISPELKEHLLAGGKIEVMISVEDSVFSFEARGSPKLKLLSDKEIVFRKSTYVDERTIAIEATAAAKDVPRPMIEMLKKGKNLLIEIRAL